MILRKVNKKGSWQFERIPHNPIKFDIQTTLYQFSNIVLHCPSLSFIVILCYSLSFVVIHCHSLSSIVIRCHSLSFVVIHCYSSSFIVINGHLLLSIVITVTLLFFVLFLFTFPQQIIVLNASRYFLFMIPSVILLTHEFNSPSQPAYLNSTGSTYTKCSRIHSTPYGHQKNVNNAETMNMVRTCEPVCFLLLLFLFEPFPCACAASLRFDFHRV